VRDKATQRVASSWHILGPHRGDLTPLRFVSESWLGGFLHAPSCGLASSHQGFPIGIIQESCLKPPSQDLPRGGISPCLVLWIGTCPCWLSPMNGDLGSTQILTQHFGAKSQIISQLVNSVKCPLFSPSRLLKHLRTGLVHTQHHLLTNQMELWDFIKPSAQNNDVYMELSHCGIPSYDHGGFSPCPYHQIPQWYPQ
jgi:hypothetical protein